MKKLLALVLALVMTLGLATVGSNAALDFADADKISDEKLEAVTVVDAIGVMKGDDTGFRPGDVLNRAEGAAILARLYGTPAFAASLNGDGSKFSDVPANFWNGNGSGVIEYCAVNGLLAGVGNGKFDPNGKLTVVAFAKMMLNALGYSTELEGYYGADWSVKVMSRANAINLLKGLEDAKPSDQITREQAAQMIFTTLKTAEVEYSNKGTNLSVNGAEISIGATDAKPVTNERRDRQTIYDNVVNARENNAGAFVVEFAEDHFPQLIRTEDFDIWGVPCTTWTFAREELGSWENYDYEVKEWTSFVTGYEIYKTIGATAYSRYTKQLWVDGQRDEVMDTNGVLTRRAGVATSDLALVRDAVDDDLVNSGYGVWVRLFVKDGPTDAQSFARLVVINTYLAWCETDYNATSKSVNLGVYENAGGELFRTAKASNVEEDITGYKIGDMVAVNVWHPNTTDATVVNVNPVKTDSDVYIDKYTTYSNTAIKTVRYNNETVTAAWNCFYDPDILQNYGLQTLKGFTYDVYLDKYGYMLGIDYHTTDTSYLFIVGTNVIGSNLASTTYNANVIWMDGTMETIKFTLANNASNDARQALSNNADLTAANGNPAVNAWFSFSKDDAGNVTVSDIVKTVGTNTRQWAANMPNIAGATYDIGVNYTTLPANTKTNAIGAAADTVAYGKDNTVYITATADGTYANNQGTIKEVNSISTGIKTTAIRTASVATLGNFAVSTAARMHANNWARGAAAPAADNANAFYLYNNSGYIIAAVVIGVNAGVGRNFVYVVSGPSSREYNGRYLDTYKVIKDNQIVNVDVDSVKTNTTPVASKLSRGKLHEVVYDKDGVIVGLKTATTGVAQTNNTNLNTQQNILNGYTYTVTNNGNASVLLQGNTMVINKNDLNNQCYVLIDNKDCTYYVQNPTYSTTYDVFSNASSALAQAEKQIQGDFSVITAISTITNGANGTAKTVIFNTTWNSTYAGGAAYSGLIALVPGSFTPGVYTNVHFMVDADPADAINYDEALKALRAQMASDGCTDIVFSVTGANQTQVTFKYNGMQRTQTIADLANYNVVRYFEVDEYDVANDKWLAAQYVAKNGNFNWTPAGTAVIIDANTAEVLDWNAAKPYPVTCDIDVYPIAAIDDLLADLLADNDTVTVDEPITLNDDLEIPAGKTLEFEDDANLIVNGDLTVKGTLLSDANITVNGIVTVDGGTIGEINEDDTATLTCDDIVMVNGAAVLIDIVRADSAVVGCLMMVNELYVDEITLVGKGEESTVAVATTLAQKRVGGDGKVDVNFGFDADGNAVEDGKQTAMILPEDGSAKLGEVKVNGEAGVMNAGTIDKVVGEEGASLDVETSKNVQTNIGEIAVNNEFTLEGDKNVVTVDKISGNGEITMDADITAEGGAGTVVDPQVTVDGETTIVAVIKEVSYTSTGISVYVTAGDTLTITFDKDVDLSNADVDSGLLSIDAKTNTTITLKVMGDTLQGGKVIKLNGVKVADPGTDIDKTGAFVLNFAENGKTANISNTDTTVDIAG